MEKAIAAADVGIAKFAGYDAAHSTQDCITCLTVKNAGDQCPSGPHEQDVLPIYTRSGKSQMSAAKYMDMVESYRPDIFHALCDGDTNELSSNKRALKSADRTEDFFQVCLERFKATAVATQTMFIGKRNLYF